MLINNSLPSPDPPRPQRPSSIAAEIYEENVNTRPYIIDLSKTPPDETLLRGADVNELLTNTIIPWRRFGKRMVYACGTPATDFTPRLPDGVTYINHVSADPTLIGNGLNKQLNEQHLNAARTLCPEEYSCRNFRISPHNPRFLLGLLFIATTLIAFPKIWLTILM